MTIERVLAQLTVTDLAPAFYATLFGREADANPVPGLLEWHLGDSYGVQAWAEPDRAGHSTVVLDESNLDARAVACDHAGLAHEGIQEASTTRILRLADPDGNRIVFTGPLPDSR